MKTAANEIEHIKEILSSLPESALHEIRDFAFYLADRRKELEEGVLKSEKAYDSIICNSVAEAMEAIYNTPDDDDEA